MGRSVAVAAAVVATVAVGCGIAALVLHARNAAALGDAAELYLADVWISVMVPPVGAFLIVRGRRLLLGSVLLSVALLSLGGVAGTGATYLTAVRGADGFAPAALAWLAAWTWTPYLLLPTLVPILFPTGTPASRRWAIVAWTIAAAVAVVTVLSAFTPGPLQAFPLVTNPLGGPDWVRSAQGGLTATVVLVGTPVALLSVFMRWRRAGPATRQHVGWLLGAVAVLGVTILTGDRLPYPWNDIAVAFGFTAVIAAVAAAAAAQRSADDLQRSRERLVVAREEERLRLHRDLHDGLGPELAGMALQLHAIGTSVEDSQVRTHLSQAEDAIRSTVAEVRRIVEDLRPPALDELGLAGAVRERAEMLSSGSEIRITVEAAGDLGDLPPAVDVAAFRIGVEAMLNAVRHSGGTQCTVRLRRHGDEVHVEVSDDGTGGIAPRPGGVGLGSMRTRAEEIGGRLTVGPNRLGGASVEAWLPLGAR